MSRKSTHPERKLKPRGKPFVKGDKRAGRPKGRLNDATVEVRDLARRLVEHPAYRAKLEARLLAGKIAPAVESMLWHYAYGKPKESITIDGDLTLTLKDANDRLASKLARLAASRAGVVSRES